MDDSLYNTSRGGLSLYELLEALEENEDDTCVDIFAIPPEDGNETEQDSDNSDDEHEANLNHLGPNMLRTECVMQQVTNDEQVDEQDDEQEDEYDSSDDLPLSKYVRTEEPSTSKPLSSVSLAKKKSTPRPNKSVSKPKKSTAQENEWVKLEPKFNINTNCTPVPPSNEAIQCKSPTDFFNLFFTTGFCETIVEQTNIYSQQKNNPINLTLRYGKYPNKRMYWSNQKDVPPILSDSMRLHRFEAIIKHFHLNDNNHRDPNDRLYKLRPIIEELNTKFRQHGELGEFLSIDEMNLMKYLSEKGFCATGTIQQNRTAKCPLMDKKVMAKKPRGTFDQRSTVDGTMTLVKWKDNKVVTAATTYDTTKKTTCVRWCRERKKKSRCDPTSTFH
ncbi:hypothetical protein NQ314_016036 [Rhamnusium bicolor]|uniref:PiggyBac transposable element-derived protein domain-containing protein n=1 Tax=Rhamnusium bicolor TaxID=1586634 RepID=A0AAV8WYB1_9CUCU|nr:hypothetical protein NQ314_016036 [Rhamnusium bicolor]